MLEPFKAKVYMNTYRDPLAFQHVSSCPSPRGTDAVFSVKELTDAGQGPTPSPLGGLSELGVIDPEDYRLSPGETP